MLVQDALKQHGGLSGFAVQSFELEHGITPAEGGHHVSQYRVGDGAGVGNDGLFSEVGGVGGDVDVVGAVGFLPVVVAPGDLVVTHVGHGFDHGHQSLLLLVGQESGDVFVVGERVDQVFQVDNDPFDGVVRLLVGDCAVGQGFFHVKVDVFHAAKGVR
ncbi:hypothetical protein [Endozoicomonas acroporae]|uniref:hypothetical protein n=1 Tax=Endozoicomonas acroporae TaxID=1701104 RepID=UPI0013D8AB37|nr:hypothetical protein [Endozoicomonas acroporae]